MLGKNRSLCKASIPLRLLYSPLLRTIGPISRVSSHSRMFHASHRRQFSVFDNCYNSTYTIITGVHSLTGLPWVLALPLTGFLVRAVLISPLSIYSHKNTQRRLALQPLLYAWRAPLQQKVVKNSGTLGPVVAQRELVKEINLKRRELSKKMATGGWRNFIQVLQFPIWLIAIETIRKMCGTHEGLLGLMTRKFGDMGQQKEKVSDAEVGILDVPMEQSLASEGALWFPDLLVPDPLLILPFVLSASLFANLHLLSKLYRKSGTVVSVWARRRDNILKILALAIGPATLQVPAAMLIYWISSASFAVVQNYILEWYLPNTPPVIPCKARQKQ